MPCSAGDDAGDAKDAVAAVDADEENRNWGKWLRNWSGI